MDNGSTDKSLQCGNKTVLMGKYYIAICWGSGDLCITHHVKQLRLLVSTFVTFFHIGVLQIWKQTGCKNTNSRKMHSVHLLRSFIKMTMAKSVNLFQLITSDLTLFCTTFGVEKEVHPLSRLQGAQASFVTGYDFAVRIRSGDISVSNAVSGPRVMLGAIESSARQKACYL